MSVWLFPDTADVLCDVLAGFGTCGLYTDDTLGQRLPFVQIGCLGGSDDKRTDRSTIDIDVFAESTPAAMLAAEQIRQYLTTGPHVSGAVVLDRFDTITRPRPFPYATPGIFRAAATYRAAARRVAS